MDKLFEDTQLGDALGAGTHHHPRKDLYRRALGQFYTHPMIGRQLVQSILRQLPYAPTDRILRVVEPFAGDGRLVELLIEESVGNDQWQHVRWQIEMWEVDSVALARAEARINGLADRLRLDLSVSTQVGDAFSIGTKHFGEFDICVTNPPWEILKPDSREAKSLTDMQFSAYKDLLRQKSQRLEGIYIKSRPLRKFAGWGTNLARCGVELSLRLLGPHGVCGVVSPASLLGDHVSTALRLWMFGSFAVHNVAYFPAELRLFDAVDQPSITVVASRATTTDRTLEVSTFSDRQRSDRIIRGAELDLLEAEGYTIPLHFGLELLPMMSKLQAHPRLSELEGRSSTDLWMGRELDETRINTLLSGDSGVKFARGRSVSRYHVALEDLPYLQPGARRIPPSTRVHRVAWRDVSRMSQNRRVSAAMVPPGVVTGNSLHVAHFRDGDVPRLRALLAILNSAVVEAQVRMLSSTGHVSLGTMRRTRVPSPRVWPVDLLSRLAMAAECGDEAAEEILDVTVARLYGLNAIEFDSLLAALPGVDVARRTSLSSSDYWHTPLPAVWQPQEVA